METVPGLSGACYRLGPGNPSAACGQDGAPQLVGEVETAIDWLVQNRPPLCAVHLRSPEYDTLDSTPLVGPDTAYCAAIGYADGRSWCPVRLPGAADRVACETWRIGTAIDTRRPGPTWTKGDNTFCTGLQSNGSRTAPTTSSSCGSRREAPTRRPPRTACSAP